MLSETLFADRLTLLKSVFESGDFAKAFDYSQVLRQDLRTEGASDPGQLGWVRFFAFRSLFCKERYSEAWTLLESKENQMFILAAEEGATVYNNAMELAVRLGKTAKDLVKWGQKALDLRLASNDLPGAVDTINTLCTFLGVIRQDSFNGKYAEKLIELGIDYNAERLIIGGVAHLMRNPNITKDKDLNTRIRERHAVILSAFTGQFKEEARSIYIEYLHFCNSR